MRLANTPYKTANLPRFRVEYHRNGTLVGKWIVPAKESGIVGVYAGGKPYQPSDQPLRQLLPYHAVKAFERQLWWMDKLCCDVMTKKLTSLKGETMGTLIAIVESDQ